MYKSTAVTKTGNEYGNQQITVAPSLQEQCIFCHASDPKRLRFVIETVILTVFYFLKSSSR